jgi:hypothetical protein
MGKGDLKKRSKNVRFIVAVFSIILPQYFKRLLLVKLLGYEIHSSARIGKSLIYPKHLIMGEKSRIGNLTLCKGLSLLQVGAYGIVGNLNWITAVPLEAKAFGDEEDRRPELLVGRHSAITNRHLIDCCNLVEIGEFTTFAGFRSQILTHTIDLMDCKQRSSPVSIGDYCFVGSSVTLLSGSKLPSFCVLGASACLTETYTQEKFLYGGVPAKPIKLLSQDSKYFKRKEGFVL